MTCFLISFRLYFPYIFVLTKTKPKQDIYIFLRILNDYSLAWILGWYSCKDFFKAGAFIPKGKDFGKFKFIKANATVLEIDKLNKF